jgi:hypothetical protein
MVTAAFARFLALTGASLALGCVPEFNDRTFLVSGPTLLAITSTPAEAAPSSLVTLSALYVDAKGDRSAALSWAFCIARKALTDQGTVSPDCLASSGPSLVPVGNGPRATGPLPADGCRLFGPDRPDVTNGEAGRPVDPDPTGGFYQPARLLVRDGVATTSIGATRIACGIGGASADVAADFATRYRMNRAPAIDTLTLAHGDGTMETILPEEAAGATVTRGEQVTLRAAWASCPTTPVCGDGICGIDETQASCPADCTTPMGCTGSEQYLVFDPVARTLATHREAVRVAWYATGGALAEDTSGRGEDEADTASLDNAWTAPATPGEVRLWLVSRDDRGGVGWQSYRVNVN